MTDLQDLHRAFAELERRADDHAAADLTVRPVRPTPSPGVRRRPLLIGATAAVLVLGAGTAVALTAGGGTTATAPAAGLTTPVASSPASPSASPSPTSTVPVATTTADLQARFTAALPGRTTFTVTTRVEDSSAPPVSTSATGADGQPSAPSTDGLPTSVSDHDVAIVGVLTSASGANGGYDVQTMTGRTGPAQCETDTSCQVSTLADGSSLAVGSSPVLDPDGNAGTGVTYTAVLVRPDGVEVLMHVSNQSDPKGMSTQLSPEPPLTLAQLTAVVTSPAWVR